VNRTVKLSVLRAARERWLERLFEALQEVRYEIAPIVVLDAYDATVKGATAAGVPALDVQARVHQLVGGPSSLFAKVLATKLD